MKNLFFLCVVSCASFAFAAPAPVQTSYLLSQPALTSAGAQKLLADYREILRKNDAIGSIVIEDPSGAPMLSSREDAAFPTAAAKMPQSAMRMDLCKAKADTARFFGVQSAKAPVAEFGTSGGDPERLTAAPGGFPLKDPAGHCVAFVGVTAFNAAGRDISPQIAEQLDRFYEAGFPEKGK